MAAILPSGNQDEMVSQVPMYRYEICTLFGISCNQFLDFRMYFS